MELICRTGVDDTFADNNVSLERPVPQLQPTELPRTVRKYSKVFSFASSKNSHVSKVRGVRGHHLSVDNCARNN